MFSAELAFVDDTNVEAVEASHNELSPKDTADKGKELIIVVKYGAVIVVKYGVLLATRFNRNHNFNSNIFDTFIYNAPIVCYDSYLDFEK